MHPLSFLHHNNYDIHLSFLDDKLTLLYGDNGKGFDEEKILKGDGLNNIKSRIQSMNGECILKTPLETGVIYTINIPIEHE